MTAPVYTRTRRRVPQQSDCSEWSAEYREECEREYRESRTTETAELTEKQEDARIGRLLQMSEGAVSVLWGHVVERGRGLNFRIHCKHDRMRDPLTVARALVWHS